MYLFSIISELFFFNSKLWYRFFTILLEGFCSCKLFVIETFYEIFLFSFINDAIIFEDFGILIILFWPKEFLALFCYKALLVYNLRGDLDCWADFDIRY